MLRKIQGISFGVYCNIIRFQSYFAIEVTFEQVDPTEENLYNIKQYVNVFAFFGKQSHLQDFQQEKQLLDTFCDGVLRNGRLCFFEEGIEGTTPSFI